MGAELASVAKMERELKESVFNVSPSRLQVKKGSSLTPRRRSRSVDSTDGLGDEWRSGTLLEGPSGSVNGLGSGPHSVAGSEGSAWGWFEEIASGGSGLSQHDGLDRPEFLHQPVQRALSLPPPVTEPPLYVLESPLPTQHLWYSTAGQRPQQPIREREHYEKLWRENFEKSSVVNIDAAMQGKEKEDVPEKDFEGEIVYRGKAPFSNAVSKSFEDGEPLLRGASFAAKGQQALSRCWNSVTLQLPRFRIVRHADGVLHAEFLVVVSLRGIHNSYMTFGIWRRHSSFEALARTIQENEASSKVFENSILSWQCFLNRKRWFRCLDIEYLVLKCFLLERFLHDVLFESQTASTISTFLDLQYQDYELRRSQQ